MSMENWSKKKEFVVVTIFFIVLVFGILLGCGTITCGMHLVDDHDFIQYDYELRQEHKSFSEVMRGELEEDFVDRFRPLYYPIRVIQTWFFGTDLAVMSILRGIEVVLSCVIMYYIARKLKCNVKYALAASLFVMVGPQSAVWWKLGPQELTATWVWGLGVLCLFAWRETGKKWYNIVAIFLFAFISLYKESYIMLFPTVMLMYLYFELDGKEVTVESILQAVKKHFASLFVLGLILVVEIFIIVFVIGTDKTGYGGIDLGMSLYDYAKVLFNNLRLPLRVGQYALFAFGVILLYRKNLKVIWENKWKVFFAIVMILPQMLLYSKTGLEERYVIPWSYGVAYLFVVVVCQNEYLKDKKRLYYDIFLGALLVGNLFLVCREANYFTYRGHGITKMFEDTIEMTDEDTKILTAFAPYDESEHTASLLLDTKGIKDVYVYRDGTCTDWYGEGKGNTISFDEIDIILMYNYDDRHFITEPDLDFSNFDITVYNTVRVAVRKGYLEERDVTAKEEPVF